METKELVTALESVLVDMTNGGKTVRLDDLIAYQKDGHLYLEWANGHTICKPVSKITPYEETTP
jgi:hypothetical protein